MVLPKGSIFLTPGAVFCQGKVFIIVSFMYLLCIFYHFNFIDRFDFLEKVICCDSLRPDPRFKFVSWTSGNIFIVIPDIYKKLDNPSIKVVPTWGNVPYRAALCKSIVIFDPRKD